MEKFDLKFAVKSVFRVLRNAGGLCGGGSAAGGGDGDAGGVSSLILELVERWNCNDDCSVSSMRNPLGSLLVLGFGLGLCLWLGLALGLGLVSFFFNVACPVFFCRDIISRQAHIEQRRSLLHNQRPPDNLKAPTRYERRLSFAM